MAKSDYTVANGRIIQLETLTMMQEYDLTLTSLHLMLTIMTRHHIVANDPGRIVVANKLIMNARNMMSSMSLRLTKRRNRTTEP